MTRRLALFFTVKREENNAYVAVGRSCPVGSCELESQFAHERLRRLAISDRVPLGLLHSHGPCACWIPRKRTDAPRSSDDAEHHRINRS
jgi:hypothetical protein